MLIHPARGQVCNFLDDSFEHEVWNDSNQTRVVLEGAEPPHDMDYNPTRWP